MNLPKQGFQGKSSEMEKIKKHKSNKSNEYQISIISFFDILGFGEKVDKSKTPEVIKGILETLQYREKPDKDLAKLYGQSFINFSDTAIRITNILNDINKIRPYGLLFWELLDLIYIQFDLIREKNIFLRGSVTVDYIYHDKNLIFGPGLNRAYRLEKNIAIYPIIVIDPRIFYVLEKTPVLKKQNHKTEEEKVYIKDLVRESGDGVWFLDYLKAMYKEIDEPLDYGKFLNHHKKLIVEYAKKFKELDVIAHKYNWLARYHNEIVRSFGKRDFVEFGFSQKELLITKAEVKTYYEF